LNAEINPSIEGLGDAPGFSSRASAWRDVTHAISLCVARQRATGNPLAHDPAIAVVFSSGRCWQVDAGAGVTMNSGEALLVGAAGLAIIGVVAWMLLLLRRLKNIERAVQSIVDNTHSLREIVDSLKSVDSNTSLLGGIGNVFGARDRKKPR
jgi:hypothetical protein